MEESIREPMEVRRLKAALFENLAALEHERWSHWQAYMHNLCRRAPTGDLIIPAEHVENWNRQILTHYTELSPAEQQSDRDQVDRYWHLIEPFLSFNVPEDVESRHKRLELEMIQADINLKDAQAQALAGDPTKNQTVESLNLLSRRVDSLCALIGDAMGLEEPSLRVEVGPDPSHDHDFRLEPPEDAWAHRSARMRCGTCMYVTIKDEPNQLGEPIGRCKRRCPTMQGYPVIFPGIDWCGEHKLDGGKV